MGGGNTTNFMCLDVLYENIYQKLDFQKQQQINTIRIFFRADGIMIKYEYNTGLISKIKMSR